MRVGGKGEGLVECLVLDFGYWVCGELETPHGDIHGAVHVQVVTMVILDLEGEGRGSSLGARCLPDRGRLIDVCRLTPASCLGP